MSTRVTHGTEFPYSSRTFCGRKTIGAIAFSTIVDRVTCKACRESQEFSDAKRRGSIPVVTLRRPPRRAPKFIQIAAAYYTVYALDDEGYVWEYDEGNHRWIRRQTERNS